MAGGDRLLLKGRPLSLPTVASGKRKLGGGQTDVIGISGVTGILGPGPVTLGIACNETASGVRYFDGNVSFVALSPG